MFRIHPRLLEDTVEVLDLNGTHVRLNRRRAFLWFVLVPETDCREIHLMPEEQRSLLRQHMDAVAAFVAHDPGVDKLNVAAIGNVVPQLHIHVIGRREGDLFWPDVLWGQELPQEEWQPGEVDDLRMRLMESLPMELRGGS